MNNQNDLPDWIIVRDDGIVDKRKVSDAPAKQQSRQITTQRSGAHDQDFEFGQWLQFKSGNHSPANQLQIHVHGAFHQPKSFRLLAEQIVTYFSGSKADFRFTCSGFDQPTAFGRDSGVVGDHVILNISEFSADPRSAKTLREVHKGLKIGNNVENL
jgi:hypothetical protein